MDTYLPTRKTQNKSVGGVFVYGQDNQVLRSIGYSKFMVSKLL